MDLMVLNYNLDAISVFDTYNSLIWTDRYNECGDFEIYTAMTDTLLDTIKQGYYLQRRDSDYVMIIESLQITTDVEEGSNITITGRSLESLLERRIIWGQKTISGNLQNGIKTLLNENLISPSNANRKISNFKFEDSTDTAITSLEIDAQYTGDNLYDVIKNICVERDIGFKVTLNDSKQFVFKLYAGTDRSYDQTVNSYVVFSPKFDNLISSNYIESKKTLKNVTLVGGEGEGSERRYTAVGDIAGISRRELFTDARDISSSVGEGETLTNDEYIAQLRQRGREKLAENTETVSFEGQAETTTMFQYGVDFFMGDVVQVANEYGHQTKARILELITSENEEGYTVYPTFSTVDPEYSGTLPDGYIRLNLIQSSGTQYIDTGYMPTQNTRVICDFQFVNAYTAFTSLFGTRDTNSSSSPNMYCFSNNAANQFRTDYFGTTQTIDVSSSTARLKVDKNKFKTTVGGVSVDNTEATGTCTYSLSIFGLNTAGTVGNMCSAKLYSFQIYEDNTAVRSFIPCKDPSDNVGLYDTVGKQFYSNAGTGVFISM